MRASSCPRLTTLLKSAWSSLICPEICEPTCTVVTACSVPDADTTAWIDPRSTLASRNAGAPEPLPSQVHAPQAAAAIAARARAVRAGRRHAERREAWASVGIGRASACLGVADGMSKRRRVRTGQAWVRMLARDRSPTLRTSGRCRAGSAPPGPEARCLARAHRRFAATGPVYATGALAPMPRWPQGQARVRPCASSTPQASNNALRPARHRPSG